MRTSKRTVSIGAVAAVLLLSACTSGPAASVAPIETEVLLASGDGEPRTIDDTANAAQGDVVSTDAAGLAELVFPDRSFMRLGPESEVEVTELGAAEVQRTSIGLEIGQTWHNVVELVADDAVYDVVTPVGVASVRGTVFSVICVEGPSCEFIVIEGEIDIEGTTLTPYQRIVLPGAPEPTTVPVDALPEWVISNVDRDAEREGAQPLADPPVAAAAVDGEWQYEYTVTATTATDEPVGQVANGTWTLTSDCAETCRTTVVSSNGWERIGARAGAEFTMSIAEEGDCFDLETSEVRFTKGYDYTYQYDVTIQEADWVDGVWTATRATGTIASAHSVKPDAHFGAANCMTYAIDGTLQWTSATAIDLTRAP